MSKEGCVIYLMSGQAHLHYLVPSLYTLRQKNYSIPVKVYAYPESIDLVERICSDPRLNATAQLWKPFEYKKNGQFINKIRVMMEQYPGVPNIYLDADTTIHGDLYPLLAAGRYNDLVMTQFCNWTSNGRVIRKRLERLREFPSLPQDAVERLLTNSYPSPNGGIFVAQPTSDVLKQWLEWSELAEDIFICDETVLHLLQLTHKKNTFVMEHGRYNCSHKYQGSIKDPYVYHYHGNSALRPEKSRSAFEFWWPIYECCIRQNFGFMQEWQEEVHNKWLAKVKEECRDIEIW